MILDTIKSTLKYTIFLGLIGMFIVWAFNLNSAFATKQIINGQEIYTFNWFNYLTALNDAWSTTALDINEIMPNREWQTATDLVTFFTAWGNDMAFIFDWLIFPLNFFLWLIRWFCWIINLLLALIGWDFSLTDGEYNSMLIKILNWMKESLIIPYI